MLEIHNLKKIFENGTPALKGVNLKINKGEFDSITPEEYSWLQKNPKLLKDMSKVRKKRDIINSSKGSADTIEEILFILDLSDRMYR